MMMSSCALTVMMLDDDHDGGCGGRFSSFCTAVCSGMVRVLRVERRHLTPDVEGLLMLNVERVAERRKVDGKEVSVETTDDDAVGAGLGNAALEASKTQGYMHSIHARGDPRTHVPAGASRMASPSRMLFPSSEGPCPSRRPTAADYCRFMFAAFNTSAAHSWCLLAMASRRIVAREAAALSSDASWPRRLDKSRLPGGDCSGE